MKNVIQFHIENGYYVNVQPLPKMSGCFVIFPADILRNCPEINRTYMINDDVIELYHVESGKEMASKTIQVPKISMRLLILQDILLKSMERKMSRYLIVTKKDMFDLLNINLTEEEAALEKELYLKFKELLEGRVSNDVNENIEEGYKKLLECFEKGGL